MRWWYKSAREGNPYRIDTNRIFIGGVSAGAVAAIHMAYVDQISELPSEIDTSKAGLGGGIEGLSGNPGYPSRVQGVINVCGMVSDTNYMVAGDEPIVSLHGTDDNVVPYGYDEIVLALWPIMFVHGSASLHERARHLGLDECFFPHPGAGHTPHVSNSSYTDTTLNVVKHFLYDKVCNAPAQCGFLITEAAAPGLHSPDFSLFPNPARNQATLRFEGVGTWSWTVWNGYGQRMAEGKQSGAMAEIDCSEWPQGMYWVRMEHRGQTAVRRLVVE